MWRALSLAAALSLSSPAAALEWSAFQPVPAEAAGRFADQRTESPNAYTRAEGDFDGDGRADEVGLYFQGDDLVVAAWLSSRPEEPIQVWRGPRDAVEDIGVATARPGTHRTACARYNWGCEGERTEVLLTHEAIVLIAFEGPAEWLYFWEHGHFENELINE
jgi:hypothetical protein